jgi:ribosome production factor 2
MVSSTSGRKGNTKRKAMLKSRKMKAEPDAVRRAKSTASGGSRNRNKKGRRAARVKRINEDRAPKAVENVKKALFLRGPKTNENVLTLLRDMYTLKAPDGKVMTKRNQVRPFDDHESIKFLCRKNDCSLFAVASHTKKRPDNLVVGRMFDFEILDMLELHVEAFIGIAAIAGSTKLMGAKPCFVFQGSEFEHDAQHQTFKSLITDFFRGRVVSELNRAQIDHVCVCTSSGDGRIFMRWYFVTQSDAEKGTKFPVVTLTEMGPLCDFSFRRQFSASNETRKAALRVPRELQTKKQKNISHNAFGDRVGRIHVGRQDFDTIQVRKTKALKKRPVAGAEEKNANR